MKAYFLLPEEDSPYDEPLRLGAIIEDAASPQRVINRHSIIPVDESKISSSTVKGWKSSSEVKDTPGVFARWLEFSKLQGKHGDFEHTAESLVKRSFHPTEDYVTESMKSPEVVDYLRWKRFRTNLYMVTEVIEVKNATSKESQSRIVAEVPMRHLVMAGAGVDFGSSISTSLKASRGTSRSIKDMAFAYNLRKVVFGRRKYKKGAMFSTDADLWNAKEDDEVNDDEIDVIGLESKETRAEEFDLATVMALDDHSGELVKSIIPEKDWNAIRSRSELK